MCNCGSYCSLSIHLKELSKIGLVLGNDTCTQTITQFSIHVLYNGAPVCRHVYSIKRDVSQHESGNVNECLYTINYHPASLFIQ